jgi:hypothetical protein
VKEPPANKRLSFTQQESSEREDDQRYRVRGEEIDKSSEPFQSWRVQTPVDQVSQIWTHPDSLVQPYKVYRTLVANVMHNYQLEKCPANPVT